MGKYNNLQEAAIDANHGEFDRIKQFGLKGERNGGKNTLFFYALRKIYRFVIETNEDVFFVVSERERVHSTITEEQYRDGIKAAISECKAAQ